MRTLTSTCGVALLAALTLAGCGSSSSSTYEPKIAFKSPVVKTNEMPAAYTCDGRNTWPPLEWGAVPAGTRSLALFVVGYTPEPATHTNKVSIEWAVAGLSAALHKLPSGKLPAGAYVGTNSNGKPGYSICPEKGTAVQYQFELYGMPAAYVVTSSGFSGVQLISALATGNEGARASGYGAFIARYLRK